MTSKKPSPSARTGRLRDHSMDVKHVNRGQPSWCSEVSEPERGSLTHKVLKLAEPVLCGRPPLLHPLALSGRLQRGLVCLFEFLRRGLRHLILS